MTPGTYRSLNWREKVSEGESEVPEFLIVDQKNDLFRAAKLARICLQEVFDVGTTTLTSTLAWCLLSEN
jgi:hypothetical protein